MFHFPTQPSVCESRRSISFRLYPFITPTPTYVGVGLTLVLSVVHKKKNISTENKQTLLKTSLPFEHRHTKETSSDKNLQYRDDYNNHTSNTISFTPPMVSTSGLLHCGL